MLTAGINWSIVSIPIPKNSIARKPFNKSCESNLLEGPKSTFIGRWWIKFIAIQTPIQMGIKVNSTKSRSKGVLPKPLEKEQILELEQTKPIANEPII